MTVPDEAVERLVELAEENIAIAEEIGLVTRQALADRALETAAVKSQRLVDNAREARRLVEEFKASQTPPPKTPEDT